ncbi:Acetyl-CoA carboxylase 1 [Camellia lanceoleosa]|uniref:Acetyl-CoA carboxylase 1 n=1 Tax=Camellia lanceoleosa TaxID=1840588 RepID=A0ACC0G736_9ERIC|nr:Acetyl-CoA carboxylase 1 [Camellia lanceoleosa]
MRVRAERPPWYLSVIGGSLYIDMVRGGPGSYRLKINQSEIEVEIHTLRDREEEAAGTRLLIDGRTFLPQNDHDPSKLVAETPCKLLRYLVLDSSHVKADIPFAEVEVMKMCMPLLSPASGIIHFLMSEGQAMQAGELIARLDLDDPSANAAQMILAGYEHNIDEVVQNLLSCLDNPELPFLQWKECLSILATRLPKDLRYEAHLNSCPANEKGAQERLVEPLMSLVKSYEGGRESHVWDAGKRVPWLIQEVREHTKAVTCLYVPSSCDKLYSRSLDKTIRIYNRSGVIKHINFNKTVKSLAKFATIKCGIIEVWLKERVTRFASIRSGGGHMRITSLTSDADGEMLFAASSEGRIQVRT